MSLQERAIEASKQAEEDRLQGRRQTFKETVIPLLQERFDLNGATMELVNVEDYFGYLVSVEGLYLRVSQPLEWWRIELRGRCPDCGEVSGWFGSADNLAELGKEIEEHKHDLTALCRLCERNQTLTEAYMAEKGDTEARNSLFETMCSWVGINPNDR